MKNYISNSKEKILTVVRMGSCVVHIVPGAWYVDYGSTKSWQCITMMSVVLPLHQHTLVTTRQHVWACSQQKQLIYSEQRVKTKQENLLSFKIINFHKLHKSSERKNILIFPSNTLSEFSWLPSVVKFKQRTGSACQWTVVLVTFLLDIKLYLKEMNVNRIRRARVEGGLSVLCLQKNRTGAGLWT